MSIYVDFDKTELPNTVHCWVERDGGLSFEKYHINNLIAGDTDSCMMDVNRLFPSGTTAEEVTVVCDDICDIVNDSYSDFIKSVFNIPDSRINSMKSDREMISDKSLFLTRKRYICHLVNYEGEVVDKLKIMGVEIKKSGTPPIVKQFLMELVNLMLDDVEFNDVMAAIKQMELRFYEASIKEIAKPISVKTLNKAYDTLKQTDSYKGISYNAKAAMLWNKINGDNKTPHAIKAGEKVGLISVHHEFGKYLAFPIDMEVFPAWFHEIELDRVIMWQQVNTTIHNYLTSMGWDGESRKATARKAVGIVFD
jgi:DNA polymerase elongation subunit (family B)